MLRGGAAMLAAGSLGVLTISLFGCEQRAEPVARAEGEPATVDFPDRYTTRGVIRDLPDGRSPMSELQIQHEYIPDFRGRDGAINVNPNGMPGMFAMIMPFPVADTVSLDEYEVGDVVELDFEVTWASPPYQITRMSRLPADTELDFGTMMGDREAEATPDDAQEDRAEEPTGEPATADPE